MKSLHRCLLMALNVAGWLLYAETGEDGQLHHGQE
jgi:hypothetical protein